MAITGGCLCKAVRYIITSPPITARACWCRLCQYIGAGNATVNAAFKSADIVITGETKSYDAVADSGNQMRRRFCPTCGVHLFSSADVRPHLIFVRVGTLDDPEIAPPQATIWTAEAPRWACISESLPQFEGQPPPPVTR